jgi:O-antigen/teichoic acid export membrane protein
VTPPGTPRPADGLGGELVRGVTANAWGRLASIAAWLLVTPLVVQALGPQRFGLWSLVSTAAGFSLVFDLGLAAAVTRFVAAHRVTGEEAAMRGALTLGVAGSAALGALWWLAVALVPGPLLSFARVEPALVPEATRMLWIMGIAFLLQLVAAALSAALAGFQRFDRIGINLVWATGVQIAGIVLAVWWGAGLIGLAWAAAAGALVALLAAWQALRAVWPGAGLGGGDTLARAWHGFGGFGLALQVVNLGILALYQLPKLFLARFVSLESVGHYELGYRVAFSAWSLPTLLLSPLLPAASRLEAEGDRERLVRLYRRASRYHLALALPLAAALNALAGPLFTLWLGPGHAPAAGVLQEIARLLAVNVLTSAGCMLARGMGRPWGEAGYLTLAVLLQCALAPWFVRDLGPAGPLVAMTFAGQVGTLVFLVWFHRAIGFSLWSFISGVVARPLAAALLAGALAWAASGAPWSDPATWDRAHAARSLAAGGAVMLVASAALLYATRALTPDDLRDLASRLHPRAERA